MQALKVKPEFSAQEVLSIMASLPAGIAEELRPLLKATDIEVYKHFLVTMYHYTRFAYDQLTHAKSLCGQEDQILYFEHMAKEERGHYLLAKRDYEEFGGSIEDTLVPASVEHFADYWYRLGKNNVNEFLGAVYVFENVAGCVGKEVVEMMQRLELTRRQSRWLRVHLEADIGHGNEALEMCQRYVTENPEAMLHAAEGAAIQWLNVFRHAFTLEAKA
jgi:hypothetical protein